MDRFVVDSESVYGTCKLGKEPAQSPPEVHPPCIAWECHINQAGVSYTYVTLDLHSSEHSESSPSRFFRPVAFRRNRARPSARSPKFEFYLVPSGGTENSEFDVDDDGVEEATTTRLHG
jgi:hypothetical protein